MNALAPENVVWQNVQQYATPLVGERFAYMTPDENACVEAIRQRRLLFRGRHREFFLGEGRSQFPVATLKVNGQERGVYVPYNLLGLISRKGADLLFGEPPSITSKDPAVQAAIEAVDRRSHLRRTLFEAAVTCSWAGVAYLEVVAGGDGAYISSAASDEVFPVGRPGPNGQYAEYRRYAVENIATAEKPSWLLLVTTYRVGQIARELYRLDDAGRKAPGTIELKAWPSFADAPPAAIEATNLDACSIVWVPNELVEGEAVSEYELDLVELQDLLNAKQSQLARCLQIHANPRMFFATGSADQDGNVRVSDEAFFGDTKDAMPAYVQMAGEPTAAMADRDFAVAALCVRAETTPELLGIKNDAAADSARKMKLAASSPLAKAQRRSAYWQPAVHLAMSLAVRVELNRLVDASLIGVQIQDGLPPDQVETAEVIATLRSAEVLSDERALQMQGLDAAAIDEELKRLKTKREETAAANASNTLFGEPPALPTAAAVEGEDLKTAAA